MEESDRRIFNQLLLALQDPNLSKVFSQGGYMEGSMGMANLSQPEVAHASLGPEAGMQAGGLHLQSHSC